jgi:hypothetical protein
MTYTFQHSKNGYKYNVYHVASCKNEALEKFAKGMRYLSVAHMQQCLFGEILVIEVV